MTPTHRLERRLSLVVIVAATAIFAVSLTVVPGFFPTFDEAKYLGIGANLWAGRGPRTVFDILFLSHSPMWPAILVAPQALLGVDALAWGRLLNAVAGSTIVALTGVLGWRVRPAVGALAAAGIVALFYLHDLTRTARLDGPGGALALAYVVVGLYAIERGSSRWAFVAGLVFALGFLVKEINLPFAPVPFLAGVLRERPWPTLLRTLGWTLIGALLGLAPWFVYYAATAGKVYRLDSPAWTIVPIGFGLIALGVIGIAADRLALTGLGARIGSAAARLGSPGRLRAAVGWGLAFAWFGAMTFAFSRTARLKGNPLLSADQIALYVDEWLVELQFLFIFAMVGIVLAVAAMIAVRREDAGAALRDLAIGTICGLPLVLLVVGVGEPPRNYFANLSIATALAAGGWAWAVERLMTSRRTAVTVGGAAILGAMAGYAASSFSVSRAPIVLGLTGAAIGGLVAIGLVFLRRRRPALHVLVRSLALTGLAVVTLVLSTSILAFHVQRTATTPGTVAREEAVGTVTAWVRNNIPAGEVLAFGSFLSYEMAYPLASDYPTYQIRHRQAVTNASAPDGLVRIGEEPADDWIAADIAPRNVNEFQAYRASVLARQLQRRDVDYWIYSTGVPTAAPSILEVAGVSDGIEEVAHWTFPVEGRPPLETTIYRIDPEHLAFDTSRLVMAPEALDRLVGHLERDPDEGPAAAARLLERVAVVPRGAAAEAALARLRGLADGLTGS